MVTGGRLQRTDDGRVMWIQSGADHNLDDLWAMMEQGLASDD